MQWFVSVEGKQYGPYSQQQVEDYIREDRVRAEHFMWKRGFPDWKPVAEVEEFAHLFPPQVPVPPPAPAQATRSTEKRRSPYRLILAVALLASLAFFLYNAYLAFAPVSAAVEDPAAGIGSPAGSALDGVTKLGEVEVAFDTVYADDTTGDGYADRRSYYRGDALVLASWDHDGDGNPETWFRFADGDRVDLELYDPGGDGQIDRVVRIAEDESVISSQVLSDGSADLPAALQSLGPYAVPPFILATLLAVSSRRRR